MKKNRILLFWFIVTGTLCPAQDLSGFWKGTLTMAGCFRENNIELHLTSTESKNALVRFVYEPGAIH